MAYQYPDSAYAGLLELAWKWRSEGILTEEEYRERVMRLGVERIQRADPAVQRQARRGLAVNPEQERW